MEVIEINFINKIKERVKNTFYWQNENDGDWRILNSWGDISSVDKFTNEKSEITYYTCLKVLSESIGKLSLHLKDKDNNKISDHHGIYALKVRPNPFMTPTDFKKLMEYNRNHYGNAYAYIKYNKKGDLEGIYPLNPRSVKIYIDDANVFKTANYLYEYSVKDKKYYFSDKEILHIKGGISENGIAGKSIREDLATTLSGIKESQKYLNDLYARGLTANAIVKYTGELNHEKKKELVKTINNFVKDEDSGNIVPLPLGMDLIPLDLKLTDAQFFELKKFTALQVAAAFGVKPNHLNNYDKSSYANSEMQNLTFYIDTLLVILTAWEEEMNYKLLTEDERKKGYSYEFNIRSILRGDLKSQAEAMRTLVSASIYKPDEARQYLGDPKLEDGKGDIIMVNGSYVKIEDIGNAYNKQSNIDAENKELGGEDKENVES